MINSSLAAHDELIRNMTHWTFTSQWKL